MKSINQRIILSEDEGRRLFNEQLPLSGIIEREVASLDGKQWSVLLLDRVFDYQLQDENKKAFRGFEVKRLLICSRWVGYDVGGSVPTSVFVLIPSDDQSLEEEKIDPKKFHFEAWAMCKNERTG